MAEISTKPYLLRAIYEWCTDNGYTPYVAVSVDERTVVPREYVKNGEIVLNVSFQATQRLKMENDYVTFSARFGGAPRDIVIPVDAVTAIYARENGQGMAFEATRSEPGNEADANEETGETASPSLASVPTPASGNSGSDGDDEPPKKGGRPTLTRIK